MRSLLRWGFLTVAPVFAACHESVKESAADTTRTADTVGHPSTRASLDARAPDTARPVAPDTMGRPHAVSPPVDTRGDSSLPRRSYASAPGWLVIGPRSPVEDDETLEGKLQVNDTNFDSAIVVYPFDSAWARVDRRRALTLLTPRATTRLSLDGWVKRDDDRWDGTVIGVHPAHRLDMSPVLTGWLLPSDSATGASALPMHDSLTRDGSLRIWTIGSARIVLRRTGVLTAKLTAEREGLASLPLRLVSVDSADDSHMGAESDSILSLKGNWRVPRVVGAFRLGSSGPVAVVLMERGYECINYRVVLFLESRIELFDDPHYYACTT